jgi:hypothetical protein
MIPKNRKICTIFTRTSAKHRIMMNSSESTATATAMSTAMSNFDPTREARRAAQLAHLQNLPWSDSDSESDSDNEAQDPGAVSAGSSGRATPDVPMGRLVAEEQSDSDSDSDSDKELPEVDIGAWSAAENQGLSESQESGPYIGREPSRTPSPSGTGESDSDSEPLLPQAIVTYEDTTDTEEDTDDEAGVPPVDGWVAERFDEGEPLHVTNEKGEIRENRQGGEPVVPARRLLEAYGGKKRPREDEDEGEPPAEPVAPRPVNLLAEEGLDEGDILPAGTRRKRGQTGFFGEYADPDELTARIGPDKKYRRYDSGLDHKKTWDLSDEVLGLLCEQDKEPGSELKAQRRAEKYARKDERRRLKKLYEGRERREKEGKGRNIEECV